MGITMTAKSTGDVSMKLHEMAVRARNPEPAWENVGSYLSAAERRQWATSGSYFGTPWRPLKPDYLLWKAKHGYSSHILMQTGSLRMSFSSRPMSIEVYNGSSARFGSNHPLAKYHQHGTRRHGKRVNPPRPMMKVTRKVRADVKQILANYVTNGEHTRVMEML